MTVIIPVYCPGRRQDDKAAALQYNVRMVSAGIVRWVSERKSGIAVAAIVAGAFALRVWAIGWGMPLRQAHIDESVMIFYAMHLFAEHVFYDYPTLFVYLLWIIFSGMFGAGSLMGAFASLDQFAGAFLHGDPSLFYIPARLLSACAGTASVYLLYRIGKEQWNIGYAPALILAVLPYHVLHSHYATTDVTAVFFLLWACLHFGRYYNTSSARELYRGTFVLGLAVATKYYPAVFFLPVMAVTLMRGRRAALTPLAIAIALGAAGFALGCPYAVLHVSDFLQKFSYHANLTAGVPDPSAFLTGLKALARMLMSQRMLILCCGWAGVFTAGVLAASPAGRRRLAFWLSFPLVYLCLISVWRTSNERYLMSVIPFLILTGTGALAVIAARIGRPRLLHIPVLAAALLCFGWSVKTDLLLARPDTRIVARQWMVDHIPPGARMLRTINTPEFTAADPYAVTVDWFGDTLKTTTPAALAQTYDYILVSADSRSDGTERDSHFAGSFRRVRTWQAPQSPPFHNPTVTLYRKES